MHEKNSTINDCAFEKNYNDAIGYHMRALQFVKEERRASLVFNVASIAIECYLLAICSYYDIMPVNHNFNYLMNAAESVAVFDPELDNAIRSLDEIFGICSLDEYFHGTPAFADAQKTLQICTDIRQMVEIIIKKPAGGKETKGESV